ncbi:MAG TPA: hypothetical protein VEC16_00335 [Alphaproteobacteria bacterium]|nr:hypothetical protein [Alphaproteobacteria bacterium]
MLELGLSVEDKNLAKKVQEEFKALGVTIIEPGPVIHINGQYNNIELMHWFYRNSSTLFTGPILVRPSDDKIFNKVLEIDSSIAKYLGCKRISTQAKYMSSIENKMLENAGYKLIKGNYKRKVE